MAKLTAWLMTLVGVLWLLPLIGVDIGVSLTAWLIGLAFLIVDLENSKETTLRKEERDKL